MVKGGDKMELIIEKLVSEYMKLDEVEAITLAGSRASRRNDSQSDIDLDLFVTGAIPIAKRREIASRFSDCMEIGNEFFGSSDEFITRDSLIDIDICFFDLEEIRQNLASVMEDAQAQTGYTTCFVYNVLNAEVLYDRNQELKHLRKKYQHVYPRALKQAIVDKNYPILRNAFSSYYHQIEKAISRGDLNSINHRVTAFLASYYDIIFAINGVLHPGEKRLLSIIESICVIYPPHTTQYVQTIIKSIGVDDQLLLQTLNLLVDELEILLKEKGFIS